MAGRQSWEAQGRRVERAEAQRRRALAVAEKAQAVWQEQQRAEHEVSVNESQIAFLLSMHKDCGPTWNWPQIAILPPPGPPTGPPEPTHVFEARARAEADSYKPTFFEKLFGGEKKRRADLADAIVEAQKRDMRDFTVAQEAFAAAQEDHARQLAYHGWTRSIAAGILARDLGAFRSVIEHLSPFAELTESGMNVAIEVLRLDVVVLLCVVRDSSTVPREEKKLSSSGKLSAKAMPAARYWGLYQDYVCGCALRVAREIFALLPVPRVVVNVANSGVDSSTGHDANLCILAASIPREIAQTLNFDALDPSDSFTNFSHRMKFKKSSGFEVVEPISVDESFVTTTERRR